MYCIVSDSDLRYQAAVSNPVGTRDNPVGTRDWFGGRQCLQTEGRGRWFQDDSRAVGFELLWEFSAAAHLTRYRAQAVILVMESSCKYGWSFAHLPALHTPPALWPGARGRVVGVPCYKEHFPTQGLKPCLLHWQADSLLLHHLGSPWVN